MTNLSDSSPVGSGPLPTSSPSVVGSIRDSGGAAAPVVTARPPDWQPVFTIHVQPMRQDPVTRTWSQPKYQLRVDGVYHSTYSDVGWARSAARTFCRLHCLPAPKLQDIKEVPFTA